MTFTLQLSGKPGASGTTIVPGSGAPDVAKGVNGDFWLDLTLGAVTLYGPKAAGAWPTTGVLLSGAAGPRGNTIIQVSGVPDASVGIAGDYAVDSAASVIYGPKTASWPAGVALKGKDGVLPIGSLTAWASGATYFAAAPASAVSYLGTSYVCSVSHTAGAAFDASKWTVLAAKGDTGPAPLAPPVGWTQNTQFSAIAPASLVTYKGSSYVCSVTHQSGSTFDITKFTLLAAKGDRGDPFAPITTWATNAQYSADAPVSVVYFAGASYACKTTHVSGAAFDPTLWQIMSAGSDATAASNAASAQASAASAAAALASQGAAKTSETNAGSSAQTASDAATVATGARDTTLTARDTSVASAGSATGSATAAAGSAALAQAMVASLKGRVFDFNLSIDPQTQVPAGGFDWNNNV